MLDHLQAVLLRDLASLRLEIEAYPDEAQLWATPAGISNSAGTLTLHCAGNLQHFIGACLGGTGFVRDREGEFGRRDVPRAELVAGLKVAAQVVERVLNGLDPARLDEGFPVDFKGRTIPTGRFLLHLATHLAYHLGQVDYHRRVVTGQGALAGVVGIPFQP
ncbi:MAG TPA: DinB family protein [Gemmatimonadales bacterium]|nr:DinB family protein [Gemmatimonadales bacterium]